LIDKEQQQSKEFKAKCLTGKFPLLETEQGHIFESSAIARFLARQNPNKNLAGDGNFEQGEVDQWVAWANSTVWPQAFPILKATFGWGVVDADTYNHSVKELKDSVKILNTHL